MHRSITRSIATEGRSMRCWWICSPKRISAHRARSCWISTTPTSRCTASRKADSSTAIEPVLGPAKRDPGDEYCYLPLYVFCGRHLLLARQRRANVAGSDGAVEEVARIVAQIRQRWPRVRIILRGDSGFCNDELMGWCEANRVDYVFGLARNRRLEAALVDQLAEAKRLCAASGQSARVFRDFRYCTIDSWNRTRRVIGKAEHTLEGSNPRFIVTSLKRSRIAYDARALYEKLYCARGEAENRIGELFADRASSATMAANQLRMSFSAMAYVLVDTLRRVGLRHGQFADAAVATIRLKLLKLGAQVRTSVRRIHFAITSGCPNKDEFELAHIYLQRAFSSA